MFGASDLETARIDGFSEQCRDIILAYNSVCEITKRRRGKGIKRKEREKGQKRK